MKQPHCRSLAMQSRVLCCPWSHMEESTSFIQSHNFPVATALQYVCAKVSTLYSVCQWFGFVANNRILCLDINTHPACTVLWNGYHRIAHVSHRYVVIQVIELVFGHKHVQIEGSYALSFTHWFSIYTLSRMQLAKTFWSKSPAIDCHWYLCPAQEIVTTACVYTSNHAF